MKYWRIELTAWKHLKIGLAHFLVTLLATGGLAGEAQAEAQTEVQAQAKAQTEVQAQAEAETNEKLKFEKLQIEAIVLKRLNGTSCILDARSQLSIPNPETDEVMKLPLMPPFGKPIPEEAAPSKYIETLPECSDQEAIELFTIAQGAFTAELLQKLVAAQQQGKKNEAKPAPGNEDTSDLDKSPPQEEKAEETEEEEEPDIQLIICSDEKLEAPESQYESFEKDTPVGDGWTVAAHFLGWSSFVFFLPQFGIAKASATMVRVVMGSATFISLVAVYDGYLKAAALKEAQVCGNVTYILRKEPVNEYIPPYYTAF